jgi:hypothetical protein
MTSVKTIPPRPIEEKRLARFPAVNARILNSEIWNIGAGTLVSIHANNASTTAPPASVPSTNGLVQPMECPP